MKVFVVIVCLWTTALASLEPAGYRPPGSSTSAQYLPPHQQQQHQPGGHQQQQQQHQQQHHHHQHDSHGSPAPSQPPPTPSSQYLPPGRPSSTAPPAQYLPPGPNYLPASDKPRPTGPPSRDYLPPAAQQPAVTPPPREYLPPRPDYLPPKPQFKPKPEYLPPPPPPSTAAPKPTSTTPAKGYLPPVAAPQPGHPGYGYSAEAARRGPAYNEPVTEAAKYDFEYRVSDEYGNDFGHKESREGLHTHGSYNVLLPDGRMQIVHYEADEHGFKPRISYEKVASVLGSKPVDGFTGYDSNANGLGHY